MTDDLLSRSRRRFDADPSDRNAFDHVKNRARLEGPDVYLEALQDSSLWNGSLEWLQDLAISEVDQRLGEAYRFLEARLYSCDVDGEAVLSHRIATFQHIESGVLFNLLPGGEFRMGLRSSLGRGRDSMSRSVSIKPFLMGRFPVRVEEWDKTAGFYGRSYRDLDLPQIEVSWEDCKAWLSRVGGGLRLASESEWEYACRAGTDTPYFWGSRMDESYCWYLENSYNWARKSRKVSLHFEAEKWNSFGLIDMSGNVMEWCEDDWIIDYKEGPKDQEARKKEGMVSYRVCRGGTWKCRANACRSVRRSCSLLNSRSENLGLRVAKSIPVVS